MTITTQLDRLKSDKLDVKIPHLASLFSYFTQSFQEFTGRFGIRGGGMVEACFQTPNRGPKVVDTPCLRRGSHLLEQTTEFAAQKR